MRRAAREQLAARRRRRAGSGSW